MAYPLFPASYQPMVPQYSNYQPTNYQFNQPYQTQLQQNNMQPGNIAWVSGISGANAYPVMPNSYVWMMDNDNPVFYLKWADNIGRTSMKIYDYTERKNEPEEVKTVEPTNFVSKDEFDNFAKEIREIVGYQQIEEKPRKEKKEAKSNG